MTNWTIARDMTAEERAKEHHCFVQHEDAGGLCERAAEKVVYGLAFCEAHGAEVETGALMEARCAAADFFERLRNPFAPSHPEPIDSELRALAKRYACHANDDRDYHEALKHAYPEVPEHVRQEIENWEMDEAPGPDTVEDLLLDSLRTLHRCIWTAYEDGATWLVEQLEIMRQGDAARCAYAMRELSLQS